jgi:hypothetical protein
VELAALVSKWHAAHAAPASAAAARRTITYPPRVSCAPWAGDRVPALSVGVVETYELYARGCALATIAMQKAKPIEPATCESHLQTCVLHGKPLELGALAAQLPTAAEWEMMSKARTNVVPAAVKLKEMFDELGEQVPYSKIKWYQTFRRVGVDVELGHDVSGVATRSTPTVMPETPCLVVRTVAPPTTGSPVARPRDEAGGAADAKRPRDEADGAADAKRPRLELPDDLVA